MENAELPDSSQQRFKMVKVISFRLISYSRFPKIIDV
jgi:hypothetical protein